MKVAGSVIFEEIGVNASFWINDQLIHSSSEDSKISYLEKVECNYSAFFVLEDSLSRQYTILSRATQGQFEQSGINAHEVESDEFRNRLFDLNLDIGCWIDVSKCTITLVRGIFGIVPLYYHFLAKNRLLFSTSYSELIAMVRKETILTIDRTTVYNYLTNRDWYKLASSSTFFLEINAIYPGHYGEFSRVSYQQVSYLNFRPEKYNHLGSLEEFGLLFKEKLANSVKTIVQQKSTDNRLGVQLSGGVDSSSISGLFHSLYPSYSLKTFFLQSTPYKNRDNYFAEQVNEYVGAQSFIVDSEPAIKKMFIETIRLNAMPSRLVSSGIPGMLMRNAAHKEGVNCLLSGQTGDEIVGYGNEYLHELFENDKWKEIKSICFESCKRKSTSNIDNKDTVIRKEAEDRFDKLMAHFLRQRKDIVYTCKKLLSIGRLSTVFIYISTIFNIIISKKRTSPLKPTSYLNETFYSQLKDSNLDKGYLSSQELITKSGIDFSVIYTLLVVDINEAFYNLNNKHEVQVYLPFLDRDVYEVSMAVPLRYKYDNGLKRGHLREAMKGLLPEEVRLRTDKFVFTEFVKKVSLQMHDASRELLGEGALVWQYANYSFYYQSIELLQKSSDSLEDMSLVRRNTYVLRVVNLAIWLDEFKYYYNEQYSEN